MGVSEETFKARFLFSRRLRMLLSMHNTKQNELADLLGVSESTVGKWVLGKSMPRTMGLVQKIADHFGVGKSFLLESVPDAVVPTVKEEYSQDEKDLISAYRVAPPGTKKIVDVTLEDYMPVNNETKVNRLAELLEPAGINCTYTNENSGNKGDFVMLYMESFEKDGEKYSLSIPLFHIDPLHSTYETLLPVMLATESTRKELLRLYINDRFDVEMALINNKPYKSDNVRIDVNEPTATKHQELDKKEGMVFEVRFEDDVTIK